MAITFSSKAKAADDVGSGQQQAPAKKKFGGLKFAVSTAAIKKMAVKTLVAGGLVIPTTPVSAPARPAPRSLSGSFNDAAGMTPLHAAARNSSASRLEALIRNGADIFGARRPAMPARPRMPAQVSDEFII